MIGIKKPIVKGLKVVCGKKLKYNGVKFECVALSRQFRLCTGWDYEIK